MALGIIHCGTFLLFAAFVLLLIATLSAPIIHTVSFLDVTGSGARSTFGTFGYCANLNVSWSVCIAEASRSHPQANGGGCTPAQFGYDISHAATTVFNRTWQNNSLTALSKALILHPIACGLSFLALLVSICSNRFGYVFASFLALLAFLASLAAMIVDFVMFGIIRREVNNNVTGRTASYSNATWMVLAATVVLFFSVFFVLFSCCTSRRNRRDVDNRRGTAGAYETGGYVGNGPQMGYAQPKKTWWSRRKY